MHFFPTLIQSGQINEKFSEIPEVWDRLVHESADAIADYHSRVLSEIAVTVPTLFIRYEDLRSNPQKTLE